MGSYLRRLDCCQLLMDVICYEKLIIPLSLTSFSCVSPVAF